MPLTMPILAQMNCTAAIIGSVTGAIQSVAKPNDAPAWVYVPMPDGSSSEAPVISPGPRAIRRRLMGFLSRSSFASSGSLLSFRLWLFDVVLASRCVAACILSVSPQAEAIPHINERAEGAPNGVHSSKYYWLVNRRSQYRLQ